jgi:hypothetical protein
MPAGGRVADNDAERGEGQALLVICAVQPGVAVVPHFEPPSTVDRDSPHPPAWEVAGDGARTERMI